MALKCATNLPRMRRDTDRVHAGAHFSSALLRFRRVMADQTGNVLLVRLLLEQDILLRCGPNALLIRVFGCRDVRRSVSFRIWALEIAPAAPTGPADKGSDARSSVDDVWSRRHMLHTTRWTDDRVPQQVVEAGLACLA